MQSRKPARAVMAALALAVLASACGGPPRWPQPGSGALLHVVLLWYRADMPPAERDALVALYVERVRSVPGVDAVWLGRPAGTPRDVVDNTYDQLVLMRFCDAAAAAAWQTHPVHEELLQRFGRHFARVLVYDAAE